MHMKRAIKALIIFGNLELALWRRHFWRIAIAMPIKPSFLAPSRLGLPKQLSSRAFIGASGGKFIKLILNSGLSSRAFIGASGRAYSLASGEAFSRVFNRAGSGYFFEHAEVIER